MENACMMRFEARGNRRKQLVELLSAYMHIPAQYMGPPSFGYRVGTWVVDRDGNLYVGENFTGDQLSALRNYLEGKGFSEQFQTTVESAETLEDAQLASQEQESVSLVEIHEAEVPRDTETDASFIEETMLDESTDLPQTTTEPENRIPLCISIPREGFTEEAISNLQKIIESKASLLKKSIGTKDLTIQVTEDRISFPWFQAEDAEAIETYSRLVTAMGCMAKNAKRVTGHDRPVDSEKFTFRSFLLRLGFVGHAYKKDRAILLKRLSGYAAFPNREHAERFYQKMKEKKNVHRQEHTAADLNEPEEGRAGDTAD